MKIALPHGSILSADSPGSGEVADQTQSTILLSAEKGSSRPFMALALRVNGFGFRVWSVQGLRLGFGIGIGITRCSGTVNATRRCEGFSLWVALEGLEGYVRSLDSEVRRDCTDAAMRKSQGTT